MKTSEELTVELHEKMHDLSMSEHEVQAACGRAMKVLNPHFEAFIADERVRQNGCGGAAMLGLLEATCRLTLATLFAASKPGREDSVANTATTVFTKLLEKTVEHTKAIRNGEIVP